VDGLLLTLYRIKHVGTKSVQLSYTGSRASTTQLAPYSGEAYLLGFVFYLYLYFVVFLSPIFSIIPFSAAKFKSRLAVAEEISLKFFK
jgi:hypothetical protein